MKRFWQSVRLAAFLLVGLPLATGAVIALTAPQFLLTLANGSGYTLTANAIIGALGYSPIGGNYAPSKSLRTTPQTMGPTYHSGAVNFTPAATPTDIAALQLSSWQNMLSLRRVRVSCTATAAATLQVLLQKSLNGGGGTSASQYVAKSDLYDTGYSGNLYLYSANRTSDGNGVSSSRPIIRADNITCGTTSAAGVDIEWDFGQNGEKSPLIKNINDWIVLNLNGQTLPSGFVMNMDFEWQEERAIRIGMVGDSTTALANPYYINTAGTGATGGGIGQAGTLNAISAIDNQGSNGFRFIDFLENLNGVTWSLATVVSHNYDVYVISYGINDVRTGSITQAQLSDMIDACLYAIHNGTINGQTYTASEPGNAGTVFTWPSTTAAQPDALIILEGPTGFTADDAGTTAPNYYLTSGQFTINAASWSGGVATYTTSAAHGYPVGTPVQGYINSVSPSGYNSATSTTPVTITATDTTHFTVSIASNPGAYVSGGTVNAIAGSVVAGQTLAQEALTLSTLMYNAYAEFQSDPRVYALVQKQDYMITSPLDGKTLVPAFPGWRGVANLANTPITNAGAGAGIVPGNQTMSNQIHANNQRGEMLMNRLIYPTLINAINSVYQSSLLN